MVAILCKKMNQIGQVVQKLVFPFKGMGFPTKSTQLQFQSQVTFYICNIILFLQADTKQYRVV